MVIGLLLCAAAVQVAELRVMSFNIWIGGTQHQPLSQTVEAIRKAKADIVGIQEPAESLEKIASNLKWNASSKASIVTRFDIVEDWKVTGNRWGGAKIRLADGALVLVYNDHLNPYPYGPYEVRDGKAKTAAEAVEVERASGRVKQMQAILDDLASRPDRELPVFLVGDFNAPSHLDWIAPNAKANFNLVVEWPVSLMASQAGFIDALRAVHPDPVAKPAHTWSPGYPVGKLEPNDVMDRIDYVMFRGRVHVTAAHIVGETGPHTDIAVDPWPSDHRAVVAAFRLPK
jgi:endonuclease/exonuclease/phosphatase family metal-dependent hydrolase